MLKNLDSIGTFFPSTASSINPSRILPFRRTHNSLLNPSISPWQPRRILDPGGEVVLRWNHIFLVSCLVALFLDPLFFYILFIGGDGICMQIDMKISVIVTVFRTIADLFYFAHMILKFRIAFVAPSSRVFGRGELVRDPHKIAMRYLKKDFIFDVAAMLPIPQLVFWGVIHTNSANHTNNTLCMIVLIQYIPRLFLVFALNARIVKAAGVVTKTAWAGAAYNLLLYMLASHVLGALWYLMSMERQYTCWWIECAKEAPACNAAFLDCNSRNRPDRKLWLTTTSLIRNCDPSNQNARFNFGMFKDALSRELVGATFVAKFLYCLWWGLRNLSSYGQNVDTSTWMGETSFCILICIFGLVLFAHLIGNMQTFLQSTTAKLEEWRIKRRDIEEWMTHRQLPQELQERVRRFVQYKWLATRGVDEGSILRDLPLDIRREIQRHLCLALVRRVPLFSQMDDQLLDAICERLVSSLCTKDTYIVREGDPVNEMHFVIRGTLESSTTNGGRSGFFNSITLRPGDFCGEELLTWALLIQNSDVSYPLSTRTVRSLDEVEAFALTADDLRFVANQFKRLHSKKLQHAFRYYSHQWRTWGSCLIQAAWRRYKKRKLATELAKQESLLYYLNEEEPDQLTHLLSPDNNNNNNSNANNSFHLRATILAAKFAKNTKGALLKVKRRTADSVDSIKLPKLLIRRDEPDDFSVNSDDR